MSWIDRLLGRTPARTEPAQQKQDAVPNVIVAADKESIDVTTAYTNRNITFSGCLKGYDYDKLLMTKNTYDSMVKLFQLSDYFTDSDEIIRGIIKEAYVPFACADMWRLVGVDEQMRERYEAYYKKIDLVAFMHSFFLQYFKYANVYTYRMPSGRLITLPVHLVRIEGVAANGEPVIEFNANAVRESVVTQYGNAALQKFIDEGKLETKLAAYPPEVAEAIEAGMVWVQLDPRNTFVSQDSKEEWVQYATPFIAACLKTLAKKALISEYEDARLRLGAHGFVLATYGNAQHDVLPTATDLNAVGGMMKNAITGSGLAVGNCFLDAKFVESDMRDLFEFDVYKNVNSALLDAGGLSSIVVTGTAGAGSSFATANLNVQTAALRIKHAKESFARMMNKINASLNGGLMPYAAPGRIPEFLFPPTDLSGNKAFQETCLKLWEKGTLSQKTLMESYGIDIKQEAERRKSEIQDGYDKIFVAPAKRSDASEQKEEITETPVQGRPKLDDTERHSDEANSVTGRNPKPSNPEGSVPQDEA